MILNSNKIQTDCVELQELFIPFHNIDATGKTLFLYHEIST